ncbi:MAG: YcxB family protein [Leptospirales bacterium]
MQIGTGMSRKDTTPSNPYAPGTSAEGLSVSDQVDHPDEAGITFLLTTDDYIAFHNRTYRWGFRKYLWLMIAVVLGLLWAMVLVTPGDDYNGEPIVPFQTLIVLTSILIVTPLLSPLLIRRQLRKYYEHITRTMTVALSPRGLRVHSDVSDLLYRWHGISRISYTARHFFIQINRYQSFIVPRRAFSDSGQEDHFRKLLDRYGPGGDREAATSTPADEGPSRSGAAENVHSDSREAAP